MIGSFIWIMVKNPEMWERFKKGDDGGDGVAEFKKAEVISHPANARSASSSTPF
jgi:hypothetical protein